MRRMRGRWRLPPVVLPEGDRRDLWAADGLLTSEPIDDAEELPGRYALPGLVDAHCHLAIGPRLRARGAHGARSALVKVRDAGVLLVRDLGAPDSVTLEIAPNEALPTLHAAGRWLAPVGGFFPGLHEPVPADLLVGAALTEVQRGARWVKVVADWRWGEGPDSGMKPSYETEAIRGLVDAVHAAGARVAAHTQSAFVVDLVALGIDSVEHGSSLDEETLRVMAARGIAWTPTLSAFTSPLPADAPDEVRGRRAAYLENLRTMLPTAARLGVTVMAGTDVAGTVAGEVARLAEFGLEPADALAAATTAARAFLRVPALDDGAPADVVTFDGDPREDPAILWQPVAILLGGRRVR